MVRTSADQLCAWHSAHVPADLSFNPAETLPEAAARMFALTAASDSGTRGPKRALVVLAGALGLEVDLAEVNAVLGGQIAEALDTPWYQHRHYAGLQVTLAGMNALLEAAADNLARLSRRQQVPSESVGDVLRAFAGFRPARSKQEAVNRICDLAGAPHDTLGPGGKEHTWTLRDLAQHLAPQVLARKLTKHELAAALCEAFGVPWLAGAGSTGATITLDGLNLILAGAERCAGVVSAGWASAEEEGSALVDALSRELPGYWDGREAVTEMREAGSTQWRQTEWAGFYFEEKVREILSSAHPTPPVGGPRVRFGSTVFDYASATRVWDAKAHTALRVLPGGEPYHKSGDAVCWLNDAQAMRECVAAQGLGFLVAEGLSGLDDTGQFKAWHKTLGASTGRPLREYVPTTDNKRLRKASFTPLELRAVWVEDTASLDAAVLAGWLVQSAQPRFQGIARNDKFQARFAQARRWQVGHYAWPARD